MLVFLSGKVKALVWNIMVGRKAMGLSSHSNLASSVMADTCSNRQAELTLVEQQGHAPVHCIKSIQPA